MKRSSFYPSFRSLIAAFICLSLPAIVMAEDASSSWPQFRGPEGNGVYAEAHPTQWDAKNNFAWSTEISGGGWSSPVSADGRIYLTTAVSAEGDRPKGFGEGVSSMGSFYRSKPPQQPFSFEVHCLDLASGDLLWKKQVVSRKPKHKIHPSNSYATESPVTDGKHVYAYFAAVGVVACLDSNGEMLWQRELGAYRTSNDFGTGSSLALLSDHLFVQCDNDEGSFVCALDAKSGEDSWRVARTGGTSWSSPVIWNHKNGSELVLCGSGNVTSYDPETGSVIWTLQGTGGAFSASPTSDRDRIYFGNSGRNSRGPLIAVNAGATGDLNLDSLGDQGVAWTQPSSAPGMCSPVVVSGRLYVLSRGILSCHDSETGERLYRQRLQNASSVTSSLWSAGGQVFALNESGQTAVINVGDDFELLGTNNTDGLYWATPSVVGESLLLRSADMLHCIRKPSDQVASVTSGDDARL